LLTAKFPWKTSLKSLIFLLKTFNS
jgi:hypothetical protein